MRWTLTEAAVICGLLEGKTLETIAAVEDVELDDVSMIADAVAGYVAELEKAVVGRMAAAEYAVPTVAKANAAEMVNVVLKMALRSKNEQVRYKAAMDMLALAGHSPVKRAEVLQVDRVLDQMNENELDAFIASGAWPTRLLGQPRQAAIDVTPINGHSRE